MHGSRPRNWNENTATHDAFVFKTYGTRRGRRYGRWIKEGVGWKDDDGTTRITLHSLPIGGFDGRIVLTPQGQEPMLDMEQPQNAELADTEDDGED